VPCSHSCEHKAGSSKKYTRYVAILLIAGITAYAELAHWVQDIPSPSRLEAVFFRAITLPTGAVEIRRPPKETRAELTKLIAVSPSEANLYALRAREEELQLDFKAAETDWKKSAQLPELADFYDRRIRPKDEIAVLESIGKTPSPAGEHLTPSSHQQAWKAFERMLAVIHEQALPGEFTVNAYRAWIARYPNEAVIYRQFLDYLNGQKQFDDAEKLIADYRQAFPADNTYPVQAAAAVAWKRGALKDAIKIYDRSFSPLWPSELVKSYFDLLKESHGLRRYLEVARAQVTANPTSLAASARVFYYYQQQGNLAAAQRALIEYRLRKESQKSAWTTDDLFTLSQLFEGVNNYDEAARAYYALYSVPGADAAAQEKALAGIANLLLSVPEQSLRFGAGDLALYSDIAQLDPGPGFLNGILSLLLNSSAPENHFATEDSASVAYFHRAKAAELVRLFDSRFPASTERPRMHARLIEAYATYGDNDGVIRAGREFLAAFPKATERTQVAIAMSDAYARKNQPVQEFALYDDLLKELASAADGVPIGEAPAAAESAAPPSTPGQTAQAQPARSPEYARILDRYISRLVSMKRLRDALALYRSEIDRNPNDPGLYERLAAFLEENKLGSDLEQIYRRAMSQFSDRAWTQKLARWYLKHKRTAEFDQLTQEVVTIFSGTELEAYIREITSGQTLAPVLYRQVNLYAHQRFPHDLAFVRNLLIAYSQRGTTDAAASDALLRKCWFYSSDLRDRFFEHLSATGRLDAELAAIKSASPANPATQQFVAEGCAWKSHFEEAAPVLQALAADFPADADGGNRAASIFRSLATYDAPGDIHNIRTAAAIELNLTRANPRDNVALTRLGEIYADRELFSRAKPAWDRIPQIQPGTPNGYLEAATIFWDYFRYEDALRLLGQGRKKLSDPALYAYEAGAIYENQRDYKHALAEYAKGALATPESPQAKARLIKLAQQPRDRDAIEQLTSQFASGANPNINAVSLRTALLTAENRRKDLEQFLLDLADQAASLELLTYLEQTAVQNSFEQVQEHTIRRQIALLTDPVERMHERILLVRFYEGRNEIANAKQVIAELYKENPSVLGVVRATVDFYWRIKSEKQAIDVLVQAAGAAQPAYRKQFTFEAARKATDAGDFERARTLLAGLVKDDPFNSEYLAATGDTYAREGNDAGLRDFYTAKLKEISAAPLTAEDRIEKVAGLRRGLIPVLTRLKDYAGAMDQYIEIINRYADDESLVRDAALYAASHNRAQQLTAYYAKTERDSPKDYRWPMTLAHIQTALENFPEAIAEYRRASDIRPDRVDLYTARASLEERLLRFDDAAATYAKVYDLNYHNSQWMEKVAEIRARQGHNDDAVAALRKALMEGRPARPEVFFSMAEKLESWGLVAQARGFAEKGATAAGSDLADDFPSGAELYARLMARERGYDKAPLALTTVGTVAATYFTPEEKQAFATFLRGKLGKVTAEGIAVLLPAAESARLADLQAEWQNLLLKTSPGGPAQPLIDIQQRRLRYAELAHQLEVYWKMYPPDGQNRDALLSQAAENFRLAGDASGELRLLSQLDQRGELSGALITRYAELVSKTPQRFLTVTKSDKAVNVRNDFAGYALENFNAARALEVIAARGVGQPPVWNRAYTGLAGLYFASPAPQVNAAFRDALGTATMGERVGKPVDRNLQLAGDLWFYYGSRYGEYLDVIKQGDPEDYLPSALEATPGHADAYFNLAEYYRESGQPARALLDFGNALQLDSKRADVHDRLALIYWQQDKHDEATREFKTALQAFAREEDGRIREDFWKSLSATLEDIGQCHVLEAVRPEADRVLRIYIHRNGNYQVDVLLRAALKAAGDPAGGVAWIVDLAKSAPDPAEFLASVVKQSWIPDDQRPAVYSGLIQGAKQKLDNTYGEARGWAETELRNRQLEWVEYLVDHKQTQSAQRALADVPPDVRKTRMGQVAILEVGLAAQAGTLKRLLEGYAKDDATMPPLESLQNAATDLKQKGNSAAARQVLEFVYNRQLESFQFSAATFLGLAEIRLEQGDTKQAVALLHRMTLVVGEPFENLSDAAELLSRTGHAAEALPFLSDRVSAVPWDLAAKAQFGKLLVSTGKDRDQGIRLLRAVAESNDAPYETRAAAARFLGDSKSAPLATASAELNLLSGPSPIPAAKAEKPYFYYARLASAEQSSDAAVKMRLLEGAIAINPDADEPKFSLFELAYGAKQYQTAISALHPLILRGGFSIPVEGPAVEDQQDNPYYSDQFLTGASRYGRRGSEPAALDAGRRAKIARELADSYSKMNILSNAAFYLRIAIRLDPSNAESKMRLNSVQAELEHRGANRQRQPVITENLEQDHPVRPRLGGGQ
jgi:tetratricopeptide (TPR) repeat protein